jgi:hypothetical protein
MLKTWQATSALDGLDHAHGVDCGPPIAWEDAHERNMLRHNEKQPLTNTGEQILADLKSVRRSTCWCTERVDAINICRVSPGHFA